MHTRIPPVLNPALKVSVLAAAVITLSGCAAAREPSLIGDAIVGAGHVTADTGAKAIRGTRRLLGFESNEPQYDDPSANQDVDLALINNNPNGEVWSGNQTNGAITQPAPVAKAQKFDTLQAVAEPPQDAPAILTTPAIDPNAIPVATVDHNHIVGPNETMWTIAKLTTGDANNWRILAEINQLDVNTPMKIGQEILIPADLVSPELAGHIPNVPANSILAGSNDINTLEQPITLAAAAPLEEVIPETNVVIDNGLQPVTQASLASDPLGDPASTQLQDNVNAVADNTMAEPAMAEPAIDPTLNAVPLRADAGETLWDMAKRTTGDATNWKAIAAHNGFTEADIGRIRYGQTIHVPVDLAKAELGGNKIAEAPLPKTDEIADAAATNDLVAAATTEPAAPAANATQESVDATASLVASASDLNTGVSAESQDIKIVEATFQTDESVQVVEEPAVATNQVVLVSGTYYPKAVYHEADFSSSLLMRVSPGTEMKVTRAMGPWYEVQTEFGVGYMHSRDIQ